MRFVPISQLNLNPLVSAREMPRPIRNFLTKNISLPHLSPSELLKSESARRIINQSPILKPIAGILSPITKTMQYNHFHLKDLEVPKISSVACGPIIAFAANTHKGLNRNENNDRISIVFNINEPAVQNSFEKWPTISIFGLFVGYNGSECSEFLKKSIHKKLIEYFCALKNTTEAIKRTFADLDEILLRLCNNECGSSCTILFFIGNEAYVGHVGESRVILGKDDGTVECLTNVHKPSNPQEKERVINEGGKIYRVILDKMKSDTSLIENKGFYGPVRVFPGNITITRAMGCKFAKSHSAKIITAIPDITHIEVNKSDEFILIACDSMFEHLSKEDVATIIRCSLVGTKNSKHCGTAVNNLIKSAALSRSKESLTCILIMFKNITLSNNPIQETPNEQNSNELHVFKFKPVYPKKNLHMPFIRYNPPQKKRAANTDAPSPYSIM